MRITGKDEIRLVDERGKAHVIEVPPGMMSDIVKPLWDEQVIVTGTKKGRKIILLDIRPASN